MKRFKKLLPIAVMVAMLMALLVPATAVAQVSTVVVNMSDSTGGASGVTYLIVFDTNVALQTNDTVTVVFHTGTGLGSVIAANVRIGTPGGVQTQVSAITVTGARLDATVAADVPAGRTVIRVGNVTNPGTGTYQLQVYTSRETDAVLSETYNLRGVVTIDSISLSDSMKGASGVTYSFTFRLENLIVSGGTVTVTFPAGTDLTSVTAGDCSLTGTTAVVNAGARTVTFTVNPTMKLLPGQPYPHSVSIANVTNTTTAGPNPLNIATSTYDTGSRTYTIISNVFVKTGGNDAHDGFTWGTAKATIQGGVDVANPGSHIHVGYGTYQENVTVSTPGVTIVGNHPAGGGDPTTTKATVQSTGTTVFTVTADNVVIVYFIIQNATGADQAGVKIDNADNCRIYLCHITGNNWGIEWSGGSVNNGAWACGITNNTEGIHAASGQGNWVWRCNITGNTDYGVNNDGGDWIGAEQNWWGHASGPDGPRVDESGNPNMLLPGKGDKVKQRVWCLPWLTRNCATVKADAIAYFGTAAPAQTGWNIISTPLALDSYVSENNTGSDYKACCWGGLWDLGKRETIYLGSHTGSNDASVLADSSASWIADELIGLKVYNTTDDSSGTITDNDATTANVTLSGGTENDWDNGDNYRIEDGHALKLYYTVETDVGRQYTPIYYYDSNSQAWVAVTGSKVTDEVKPVDAYYVRMKAPDAVPILFSPDKSVPGKQLYAGWNLVGYSYMPIGGPERGVSLSASIEIALKTVERVSSAAGDVKGYAQVVSPPMNQYPWIYIPPAAGGAEGTFIAPELRAGEVAEESCVMVVGRGYWVFMANPGYLAGLTFTPMSVGPEEW